MKDADKVIEELETLYDAMHENQCYACSHEFVEVVDNFGTEIIADAIEMLKEQQEKIRVTQLALDIAMKKGIVVKT